jgi:hypothetical protein
MAHISWCAARSAAAGLWWMQSHSHQVRIGRQLLKQLLDRSFRGNFLRCQTLERRLKAPQLRSIRWFHCCVAGQLSSSALQLWHPSRGQGSRQAGGAARRWLLTTRGGPPASKCNLKAAALKLRRRESRPVAVAAAAEDRSTGTDPRQSSPCGRPCLPPSLHCGGRMVAAPARPGAVTGARNGGAVR